MPKYKHGDMLGIDDWEVRKYTNVVGVSADGRRRVWDGTQLRIACQHRGCPKRGTIGYPHTAIKYCATHKSFGMVNKQRHRDRFSHRELIVADALLTLRKVPE